MKKFKVINDLRVINDKEETIFLRIGDIVTLVEGSNANDLYELPKKFHGKGHMGSSLDPHLNLKKDNYLYIMSSDLEEIKGE